MDSIQRMKYDAVLRELAKQISELRGRVYSLEVQLLTVSHPDNFDTLGYEYT